MADRQGNVRRQGKPIQLQMRIAEETLKSFSLKGYELAEEEVRISLDEFRENYTDASGGPEYATSITL